MSNEEIKQEDFGDSGRGGDGVRSERDSFAEAGSGFDATAEESGAGGGDVDSWGTDSSKSSEALNVANINAFLQQNYINAQLPLPLPNAKELELIRENSPEVYALFVKALDKSIEADYIARTYPYTEPLKNANAGRRYGIIAVLGALGVAAYAVYLGYPWLAGIITALDLVGLTAVFRASEIVEVRREEKEDE